VQTELPSKDASLLEAVPLLVFHGRGCRTKILSNEEAARMLAFKIKEEADEFILKPSKEEMADLAEVLYAIAEKHGWNWAEIEKVREEKKLKRGGRTLKGWPIRSLS
jgi:predicted house-cleaning noncanonical NTP pyrophosphatase (MazG superfamily)